MVNKLPERQETWVRSLVGKIPWRRQWLPTPVLLPGESHDRGACHATVNAKECSNYCTTVLISHVSKIMLKILQARLQQNVN